MTRAQSLRNETALNSITPERAGGIMFDTLAYINQMQLDGSNPLLISKIYDSVASMGADSAPVSDLDGSPLRPGQLVCIVTGDPDDPDDGVVYRYDGTEGGVSSWTAVGKIGSAPYLDGALYMGIAEPDTVPPSAPRNAIFYLAKTAGEYTNFDGLVVNTGEVAILKWDSSWSKEKTGAITYVYDENVLAANGEDATIVSSGRLAPASRYCVFRIVNKSAIYTDIDTGYLQLRISAVKTDGTVQSMVEIVKGNTIADEYPVILPEDTEYCFIYCRVASGKTLMVRCVYLEDLVDITNEFHFLDNYYILAKSNRNPGKLYPSSIQCASDFFDVSKYSYLVLNLNQYITSAETQTGLAFYDEKDVFISGVLNYTGGGAYGVVETIVPVPAGAKYIRVTKWLDEDENGPFVAKAMSAEHVAAGLSAISEEVKNIGLHAQPDSMGVINAVKRARQLTDAEFTPAFDLVRVSYLASPVYGQNHSNTTVQDKFSAGRKYKGLPYSETGLATDYGYAKNYIGDNVSLETFLSCVRRLASVVGQESEYNAADVIASFYGVVCSSLVSYAIGIPIVSSAYMPDVDGMDLIGALVENNARLDKNRMRIGFILRKSGHCAIITDIIHDGDTWMAEVSECSVYGQGDNSVQGSDFGGKCRRKWWREDEFFEYFQDFAAYEYTKIADVKYDRSDFVKVGHNEPEMKPDSDLPCMPYMGEKFVYKKGYIVDNRILIFSTGFNTLRVLKDGVLFGEYAVTNETTSVAVPFTDSGIYEAYLVRVADGADTGRTVSCHWLVTDAAVTLSESDEVLSVSCVCDVADDAPVGVTFTRYQRPFVTDLHNLTRTEQQDGTVLYTFSIDIPGWVTASMSAVRVRFRNIYGSWDKIVDRT